MQINGKEKQIIINDYEYSKNYFKNKINNKTEYSSRSIYKITNQNPFFLFVSFEGEMGLKAEFLMVSGKEIFQLKIKPNVSKDKVKSMLEFIT